MKNAPVAHDDGQAGNFPTPRYASSELMRHLQNLRLSLLLMCFLLTVIASSAVGSDGDPQVDRALPAESRQHPDNTQAVHLRQAALQIRELSEGTLDAGILPADLFDVQLTDESTIRLEAERLRIMVEAAKAREQVKSGEKGRSERGAAPGGLDPELWAARLELDRARLAYYLLPAEERLGLLAAHEERRRLDVEARAAAELNDSERRARAAEDERLRVLEAAQRAHSEAERVVEEERARLLGVASAQAEFEADLVRRRQALQQRAEKTLGLRRQTRELIQGGQRDTQAADVLYDQLRGWLRQSRDELAAALVSGRPSVPSPGGDRLADLGLDIDTKAIEQGRRDLLEKTASLKDTARQVGTEQLRQLSGEVVVLNADRLALLSHLSEMKRKAITGFTPAGFDQAAAELRQISLVLRYHAAFVAQWFNLEEHGQAERTEAAVLAGLTALRWSFAVVVFLWWRRRFGPLLRDWQQRLQKEERRWGRPPSRLHRSLGLLLRIRRPLQWLLLAWVLILLLPQSAEALLEVGLAAAFFTWTLGGWLAVATIDELAATREPAYGRTDLDTSAIRLRSLRLIGRTVVIFGLGLTLTDQLVGQGTIHQWVISICWIASIPVFLVVVRWWQEVIFERVDLIRKKGAFEQWVVDHRSGWPSFIAAVAGGVFLFVQGGVRAVRTWSVRFDFARRIHAYLFRRGLDRLAEERPTENLAPLPESLFTALAPETPSASIVRGSTDAQVEAVVERIGRIGGGVFAVVGERGAGKSNVLQRVSQALQGIVLLDCPQGDVEEFRRELVKSLGIDADAGLEEAAAQLDSAAGDSALLVDNAHRLIRPVMGGLAGFDRLVQVARQHSARLTWFFALDEAIWRFLQQARGARPLFDEVIHLEPWREEEIVALLTARCRQADIRPRFEGLIEELPPDADEIDREEAATRAAAGYYRLLWDHAAGNPGVALHMWRRSLGLTADGEARVRFFSAPDSRELEELPDAAVFVLRAVVQLEPAQAQDIVSSTMLGPSQVADALRYGLAHGYFERTGERYRVTWGWFRTITRFLQRRHLLAAGQ